MKAVEAEITDFFSIEHVVIQLADRGLVTVFGRNLDNGGANSNGSGKSALWDAIFWALYGKTFRGSTGDEVLRTGGKGCRVAVTLQDGQTKWQVIRFRGHPKGKNSLQLFCNGSDVSSLNTKETQEKIEDLLGMDYQTFSTCVIFGQDTFRFAGATDSEQKAILDRILGMELYEKAYESARQKRAALEKELQPIDQTIRVAESVKAAQVQMLKTLDAGKEAKEKEVQLQKKRYLDSISALKVSLLEHPIRLVLLADEIPLLEEQKLALTSQTGISYDSIIKSLESEISQKKRAIKTADDTLKLAAQQKASIERSKLLCRECGQTVAEAEYSRQLLEATKTHDEAKAKLDELSADKRIPEAEKELADNRKKQAELEGHRANLRKVTDRLSSIKAEKAVKEADLQALDSKVAALQAKADTCAYDPSEYLRSVQACKDKIEEADKLIADSQESKTSLLELMPTFDFWIKGFGPGGIRSFILDSVTPYLNERVGYYAGLMFDGTVRISFETQSELKSGEKRDKFRISATNLYGSQVYHGNSAGERQRVDFCVALALQDLARTRARKSLELVVFDEAFERMDESGCERAVRVLRKKAEDWKSCFIVTHLDHLTTSLERSITIVKKDGKSFIGTELGEKWESQQKTIGTSV